MVVDGTRKSIYKKKRIITKKRMNMNHAIKKSVKERDLIIIMNNNNINKNKKKTKKNYDKKNYVKKNGIKNGGIYLYKYKSEFTKEVPYDYKLL